MPRLRLPDGTLAPLLTPEERKQHQREASIRWRLKHKQYATEWYQRNRAKRKVAVRAWHLKDKYGLSVEEFAARVEAQGGACAVCTDQFTVLAALFSGRTVWHVDHDHETGAVRGVLCFRCNAGLGSFKDDPERLSRAASYLLEYKAERG